MFIIDDFSFSNSKTTYLTHGIHPYRAKFIPQIPKYFIEIFTRKGETILDPMCGSGTTVLESFISCRHAIGNDLNPIAAIITKTKTTILKNEEIKYITDKINKIFVIYEDMDVINKEKHYY